ncbi:MAG: indolepyruvate ferredoxin oxidoreductase subunit alpha [Bacteroidales bacterium]|jgi:indolepyruvate ferredoxin oxidoreductase alpha subunit|nr:indolepyruvate ferredoxin oxidoreductase subunit alpha [Bacteroidales bacterium]
MEFYMSNKIALLGDEAVALGAIHAGISAAYGYPGTPSTEILQYLIDEYAKGGPVARWCSNEKTALEAGLGVSFAGRRSLITMKHVGLNVAADAFINSALLGIKGGLVIIVADDPGMHSSQNEQDTRFYANFAMTPCLEPRNQQEAYDMVREAFDISEKFEIPVIVRLVTRLAHARAAVTAKPPRQQNPVEKTKEKTRWMLLPIYARKNYAALLEKQKDLQQWAASHYSNKLSGDGNDLAIITSGLGGNYYEENLEDFIAMRKKQGKSAPVHLHIGAYPLPENKIRKVCENAEEILVIEEGQPFIAQRLFGIAGLETNPVIQCGELDPDNVRSVLGLPPRKSININTGELPSRPPQLCQGCPHCDSYESINKAVKELDPRPGHPDVGINSDIGCYSLGATPPYSSIESLVCMGACVGMAKGAAEAGLKYAIAVIGDSTFIHGGITALIDAVQADTPMTLIILDNSVVAMTGCQPTMLNTDTKNLVRLVEGCGVNKEHILELEAKRQFIDENAAKLKAEIEYKGLSVVIFRRECIEAFRKNKKANF